MDTNPDNKKKFLKNSKRIFICNIVVVLGYIGFFLLVGENFGLIFAYLPLIIALMFLSLITIISDIYLAVHYFKYKDYKMFSLALLLLVIVSFPFYLPLINLSSNSSKLERMNQQLLFNEQQEMAEKAILKERDELMKEPTGI
ncbi:MAG TPA: hypothetical protein VFQ59_00585 [Candidatus Paceibacterota bacterium]|nr:hypothetical protein [Candidatus Paceibacterota bacterium]